MPVKVVSTGGTIASTETAGGDAAPELTGEDLVAAVPEIETLTEVEVEDFSTVPSPHLTIEDVWDLTARIRELDSDADVDGIVITHGTSTLEESAYFLDLCYDGETPVVFTGAMRNPSLVSPDGPGNVLGSVRTAIDDRASGQGALVVLNDRVHTAREVTKTHSSTLDTFREPEFGHLATIEEDRVTWRRQPVNPDPVFDPDPEKLTNEVGSVWVTVDMPETRIPSPSTVDAVCLAGTGTGGFPPHILPKLRELRAESVPLVATTRCPEGRLGRSTYDFPGSHATLRELEAYFSDLNLQKTRIRAIVALAADRMADAFDQP